MSRDNVITDGALSLLDRSIRHIPRARLGAPFGDSRQNRLVAMTLLLASNRLPVSLRRTRDRLDLQINPGGVAAGLGSFYREFGARWFGWAGDLAPAEAKRVAARLRSHFNCHAVFLPRPLARAYYAGFSNGTVWPLFHSFPTYATFRASDWEAYRSANERFAETIARAWHPGDVLWIHDYHLLLLPQMIRERLPQAQIGFFLHIPFPPYDVLRLLPRHRELLRGVLGADLIGFHTYDYARAFLGSVRRTLGYDNELGSIVLGHRAVQVDVFPLGIDFDRFASAPVGPSVMRAIARLRKGLGDSKLLFSISRLDYTKGIPQQLDAFERFLELHPGWRGKVAYLLAVVPSREKVAQYARLKREIDERVGRINSAYGSLSWTPIRYVYRQLDFDELLALYRSSDVAFVTPLRDGMNLIAKEYVASRADARGVLILSEMAGTSKELLEALVVNPNDVEEVAEAIRLAVTMSEEEQARRISAMQGRLRRYDARTWAVRFIERLGEAVRLSHDLAVRKLSDTDRRAVRKAFRSAARRLLLLDYDGTLVGFSADRGAPGPDARVTDLLKHLGSMGRSHVVLVSGRTREDLERWFSGLPLTLIAEHGGWVRHRGRGTWRASLPPDNAWKDRIRPVMERFVDRVPGSSIEEKDFSLAWHYRASDVESGTEGAMELVDIATSLTANMDLKVLPGKKVVEVRRAGVHKGTFVASLLTREPADFVLAAGDDATDEAMFAALPSSAFSIRVGFAASAARFNVEGPEELVGVLESLAT